MIQLTKEKAHLTELNEQLSKEREEFVATAQQFDEKVSFVCLLRSQF